MDFESFKNVLENFDPSKFSAEDKKTAARLMEKAMTKLRKVKTCDGCGVYVSASNYSRHKKICKRD